MLAASLRRYDDDAWDNLHTAETDATTLAVFLEAMGYKLPPKDVVPPGVCTRAVMELALAWLCEVTVKGATRAHTRVPHPANTVGRVSCQGPPLHRM